jgi:hypothetical protein
MKWKSQDWVEHASFGLGRVNENRDDRLDIEFINSGAKTILRTTDLKPANPSRQTQVSQPTTQSSFSNAQTSSGFRLPC